MATCRVACPRLKIKFPQSYAKQKIAGDKTPLRQGFANEAYSRVFDEVLRRSGNVTATANKWGYLEIATAMSKPSDYTVGYVHKCVFKAGYTAIQSRTAGQEQ